MEELIVKQRDLYDEIIKVINEKNLPAFIIKPIIKELYEQVQISEQQQYEIALKNKREVDKNKEIEVGNND